MLRIYELAHSGQEFCKNCRSDHLEGALRRLNSFRETGSVTHKARCSLRDHSLETIAISQVRKPFLFHYIHDAKKSRVPFQKCVFLQNRILVNGSSQPHQNIWSTFSIWTVFLFYLVLLILGLAKVKQVLAKKSSGKGLMVWGTAKRTLCKLSPLTPKCLKSPSKEKSLP